jgi:hypothetical protein
MLTTGFCIKNIIYDLLSSQLFWTIVGATGVFLTAFYTLKAARATLASARATQDSSQAYLLSQLISEYASDGMLDALREISDWRRDNPDDFADKYATLRIKNEARGLELDKYRRRISHYFTKLRIFCERNLINKSIIEEFFLQGTFEFIRDVIQPLEEIHRERVIGTKEHRNLSNYYNSFIKTE